MKGISCNSNLLSELPVEQAIDLLAEHGCDAIDICMELAPPFCPVPTPHMSPDDDAARRKAVRRRAQQAGIAVGAMNAHTNLCARDPQARRANMEFLKGAVQVAADMGASVVATGGGAKDAYGYEQWYFDWAIDTISQVLPLADRLGITLAIEAGSPPGCLVYNLKTMQKLLATDGFDSLAVLYDPAHYHLRGDDPVEAFNALKDRVAHVHAKDAGGDAENIIFPPLGQGAIDFDALLGAMAAAGFKGYIAIEYEAFAWDFPKDPPKVLPQEKAFLDPLIARHWN